MKHFSMKIIAWAISAIMIAGTIGSTSQHYLNIDTTKPTDEINADHESIQVLTKTLPSEEEKLSVSVRSVEEETNEIKPIKRESKLDPIIEEELLKKKMEQIKPIQGLFETTVETVESDDKISIDIAIKNISSKDLQISYGSGQQFDIWVYNELNILVYKWSLNKAFTMALITRELEKSGQMKFSVEWNLKDNKGNPVPTGKYAIKVKVMIGLELGNISPDELVAKTTVEIN